MKLCKMLQRITVLMILHVSVSRCAMEVALSALRGVDPAFNRMLAGNLVGILNTICATKGDDVHNVAQFVQFIDPEVIKGSAGSKLLYTALSINNDKIAQLLISHNANLQGAIKENCTALHLAATGGNVVLVQKLIQLKAHISPHNALGHTPLLYACVKDHPAVVYALRLEDARDNMLDNLSLASHLANNSEAAFFSPVSQEIFTKVISANRSAYSSEVQEAIAQADAVRTRQSRALSRMLLCPKTSPLLRSLPPRIINTIDDYATNETVRNEKNAKKEQLWQTCCSNNNEDSAYVVATLLRTGIIDVNFESQRDKVTFLQHAAQHGNVNIVRCLLEHQADPNLSFSRQDTSLSYACTLGHVLVAEVLREYAANDSSLNWDTQSPAVREVIEKVDAHRVQILAEALLGIQPDIIDIINRYLITPVSCKTVPDIEISFGATAEASAETVTPVKRTTQCCVVM